MPEEAPQHDEFVCTDCGCLIISLPPMDPPPTRCALCEHLLEFVDDPEEREGHRRYISLLERHWRVAVLDPGDECKRQSEPRTHAKEVGEPVHSANLGARREIRKRVR